jgi:hypothetical protein
MKPIRTLLLAGAMTAGAVSFALAQGTTAPGAATGGSAGSAAVGGTSASSLGTGGTSGGSSTIGAGASAAGGQNQNVNSNVSNGGNSGNLNAHAKGQAMDQGTFSKSMTHTKVHKGEVSSRTKTMAHEPGSKPVKSTTGISTGQ